MMKTATSGVDPDALLQRLSQSGSFHLTRRSIDENAVISPEEEEHRKQFENHRKKHYNEFEVVRLHKKEIEAELRALEEEEAVASGSEERGKKKTADSIKPILVHDHSSHHPQHHVHVEDDHQHDVDEPALTPDEQEKKKQFELRRKKHYNEFRVAHSTNEDDKN